jgi:hypothetical protein
MNIHEKIIWNPEIPNVTKVATAPVGTNINWTYASRISFPHGTNAQSQWFITNMPKASESLHMTKDVWIQLTIIYIYTLHTEPPRRAARSIHKLTANLAPGAPQMSTALAAAHRGTIGMSVSRVTWRGNHRSRKQIQGLLWVTYLSTYRGASCSLCEPSPCPLCLCYLCISRGRQSLPSWGYHGRMDRTGILISCGDARLRATDIY